MRLKEISIQFYPPTLVATLTDGENEEHVEFEIPPGINQAREIYNYLVQKNALFELYKKETKHFSKQLAGAEVSCAKYKLKSVVQPHFAPIVQVVYARASGCFVFISSDCSASVHYCEASKSCTFELPARPSCVLVLDSFIAVGLFNGCVGLYGYDGTPLHQFCVQSVPTTLCLGFQTEAADNCLLAGLYDGRVLQIQVLSADCEYETQIRQISKHGAPAVFVQQVSAHKFATAGLDGIMAFEDVRRAASRLSAESKATFFAKDSPVTAVCEQSRFLCVGFASGEWRGVEIGSQGFKMVFEGYEKRAISACALNCDGSIACIASLGHVVVHTISSGARWDFEAPGEVRELLFLHPREEQRLVVAADRLLIVNVSKKTREEFQCTKISFIDANYDGSIIAAANAQGEVMLIHGE